jgi:hypothetical protein
MDQKVKQHRLLKYSWLLHAPKKFLQSHLLRPGSGSGSDPRRPDPDPQHWYQEHVYSNLQVKYSVFNISWHIMVFIESNIKFLVGLHPAGPLSCSASLHRQPSGHLCPYVDVRK